MEVPASSGCGASQVKPFVVKTSWAHLQALRCPTGKTSKPSVNPRGQKYSTLPKFGNRVCVAYSGPRKRGASRSSRTRAGRRWAWVTSARRVLQGGQP
ncbi:hypothetical protein FXB38_23205 [Bradyrhizobium cytisi]|uniref:Uncharacterized protein n=1 Tax=Bradyrhizobium cytisi TaxID=515489 RepID=A0A5S4WIA6_9BRAD|nr:hypothetical protein FXB38_23205 [Bradyrhizobium cytisi]